MARENVETKARRYLSEGRVTVTHVDGDTVRAIARGAGDWYGLGYDDGQGWWCSCPARTRCAHVAALQLVATRPNANDLTASCTA